MTEKKSKEYNKKNTTNEIAISPFFKPTIEITDYINYHSLEELIIKEYENLDINEQIERLDLRYGREPLPCNPKYVPENSNLAKVFFVQDYRSFIIFNRDYYDDIISKYQFKEWDKGIEEAQEEAQKNWDKYL